MQATTIRLVTTSK